MTDELTERARQLSAEAEHLYGVTKRRKEALRVAKDQALKATGEAASPTDRCARLWTQAAC